MEKGGGARPLSPLHLWRGVRGEATLLVLINQRGNGAGPFALIIKYFFLFSEINVDYFLQILPSRTTLFYFPIIPCFFN
jgi:hypothetical protein